MTDTVTASPVTPLVLVDHNFETAHRLPHLPGKCQSLHGHSWRAKIAVAGPPGEWPPEGVLADFGALKTCLRGWIDTRLDHGTMLGADDPLGVPLTHHGTKLFLFDGDGLCDGLWWPTVENVAELLRRVTNDALATGQWAGSGLRCRRVRVQETHVNAAEVTL